MGRELNALSGSSSAAEEKPSLCTCEYPLDGGCNGALDSAVDKILDSGEDRYVKGERMIGIHRAHLRHYPLCRRSMDYILSSYE